MSNWEHITSVFQDSSLSFNESMAKNLRGVKSKNTEVLPLSLMALATENAPIPCSTADDISSLVKHAGAWPTLLPNNWVVYSQTGGTCGDSYSGPVVSTLITIGMSYRKACRIILFYSHTGQNMVSERGYNCWLSSKSLAISIMSSSPMQLAILGESVSGVVPKYDSYGYMTTMLPFNFLEGTAASVAPVVVNVMASYWHIGQVEANYNPTRVWAKRDVSFTEHRKTAPAVIEKRAGQSFYKYSTDSSGKVDRYGE
ncbi:hypothetical protein GQ43DRAFT_431815 [Delitschia confertaspora ATCC 74209]|uniref:Uncharacterized protein n=1 Tax=Delitschia confertaspora ATCC 74209 TaxID=1513339 RepID=A0A9P4JKN3_9PLEO|nr:hypothetical protein GQ43DRAFT_431815 [Delitschia confertaspora ATCC 74209]